MGTLRDPRKIYMSSSRDKPSRRHISKFYYRGIVNLICQHTREDTNKDSRIRSGPHKSRSTSERDFQSCAAWNRSWRNKKSPRRFLVASLQSKCKHLLFKQPKTGHIEPKRGSIWISTHQIK